MIQPSAATPQPSTAASPQPALSRAAFYLAFSSSVAVLFSIAVSQSLLALAVASLLMSGTRLRLPPVWLPLALFMAATAVSLAFSGDPAAGRPQIRKFYVYLTLLVVYSTFRRVQDARYLVLAWGGAAGLSAGVGLVQFARKIHEAHQHGQSFYEYYIAQRITGFMSNWQTFGGEQMIALILLAAFLLFSPGARGRLRWPLLLAAALLGAALLLGYTRGIWLASACAALYLVWFWKRPLLLAMPVALVLVLWADPGGVRDRFRSAFAPHGDLDSNQHRIVCWRIGWNIIRAHPWLGLGPDMIRLHYKEWVPPDVKVLPTGFYEHLHSIYVHYAADRGVPAMLILVWLLVKILRDFLRAVRKLPPGPSDERFLLHGGVAVVLAIMISGAFEVNLGDSEVLAMFLAAVAAGYVACDRTRAHA